MNLNFPKNILEQMMFILFLPCNGIIYLLPNYHKDPSVKKLVACFFLNIILIGASLVGIDYFMGLVSQQIGVKESIIGMFFIGTGMQIPFLVYNIKFVGKDSESAEFLQSFIQLSIFKTSVCVGLTWLIDCIGNK